MRLTVDTNIVLYACDPRAGARHDTAVAVMSGLLAAEGMIGLQVCGETFHNLRRKLRWPGAAAEGYASDLLASLDGFAATSTTTLRALAEAAAGRLSFWDANLLSAAEAAGCTHVVSEDMADGFRLGSLEVVNPFSAGGPSARLRELLSL